MQPLARLRLRLTAWYAGIFVSILALLGGGLFFAIRHRMSQQLDASLRGATSALMRRPASARPSSRARRVWLRTRSTSYNIPDRSLYLLAEGATPVRPAEAPTGFGTRPGSPSVPGRHTASERRNRPHPAALRRALHRREWSGVCGRRGGRPVGARVRVRLAGSGPSQRPRWRRSCSWQAGATC